MSAFLRRLSAVRMPVWSAPLALLGASLLSYGVLLPWLGFYWDDWAFVWISQKLGPEGLARYFSTNRPVWGLLYPLSTALVGSSPLGWQIFGLVWHWLSAVSLWGAVRALWPKHAEAALWISLLYVVYPGFDQQAIAITYGHFFIVLTLFFSSYMFTALAFRQPRRAALWTVLALLTSLANLMMMEYFFVLELLRAVWLWVLAGESALPARERLRQTLRRGLPYALLFLGAAVWRAFFFRFQTQNYELGLLTQLQSAPLNTLAQLAWTVVRDVFVVSFGAWAHAFRLPDAAVFGARTLQLFAALVTAAAGLTGLYLGLTRAESPRAAWAKPALLLGGAGLLLGGWPFWLTGLPVGLEYPNSRFTLSFVLGASFWVAGLIAWLPLRRWMRVGLLAVLVAAAVGMHFQDANAYRREWNFQKALFWQLSWRAPGITPGTALLFNDLPLDFCSDNTLTAPLNWIYAPDNRTQAMSYMLYFTSVRVGRGLPALQSGLPIEQNYLAAWFSGNTSQVLALTFSPPGCLRVLDPVVDAHTSLLSELMRQSAALSDWGWITSGPQQPAAPDPAIFGPEPPHNWCYYYQKAELARQEQDWQTVADLGQEAFALSDHPNDPAERLPFIEGYAKVGDLERALALTEEAHQITPLMQPALCRLWGRIANDLPDDPAAAAASGQVRTDLGCPAESALNDSREKTQ